MAWIRCCGGNGGSSNVPVFSETKIVDNPNGDSSFTPTNNYHNYDIIKIEITNTGTVDAPYSTYIYTTPNCIDLCINSSFGEGRINLNEPKTDQYVCYSVNTNTDEWTRFGSRNCALTNMWGLTCTNFDVQETELFEAQGRVSAGSPVAVTLSESIYDFDYIFVVANSGAKDEIQPCCKVYQPNGILESNHILVNHYNGNYISRVDGDYDLSPASFAYISGIKFIER